MNLLLDIDGVLINWDAPLDTLEESTGFNDFVKVKADYFNHVSYEQLDLINDLFGEQIRWLTTWELGPVPLANSKFAAVVGWRERDSAVWGTTLAYSYNYNWWKAEEVNNLLKINHPYVQGRVVWVDDELADHWYEVKPLLERYNALDRFRCISPYPVWSRKDIESAYEWAVAD